MSLLKYKKHFDNTYQEIANKSLVAKKSIANTRFENTLSYGESVERVAFDISAVQVRDVVRGSASTIDTVTDSSEFLTINVEKESVIHISDGEVSQTGPLRAAEEIGGEVARKLMRDLDARVFGEVQNMTYDFDAGDLTTGTSSGTPITLSTTTVPQLTTRASAKLRRLNNIDATTNSCWVIDSYAAADFEQFLISKQIDLAGSVFANGYAGKTGHAEIYVSENLTGETVLTMATNPTDGDTITINGVVITFEATLASDAAIHIASTVDITRANLVEWLNAGGATAEAEATDTGYSVATAADQALLAEMKITATNDNTANTATVVCQGTGRLTVSATDLTAYSAGAEDFTSNFIHAYFGKKGSVDLVVQDMKEVKMFETTDRLGVNIFSYYLAGYKLFADGAKKGLDVLINV